MDKIKAYIEMISLVSIFAGVVSALIPQGKLKNAFSAFCAAVIIFSAVNSVAEVKISGISLSGLEAQKSEQQLLSDVKTTETTVYESVLGSAVEKALEESGYIAQVKVHCENEGEEIRTVFLEVQAEGDEKIKNSIEAYLKKSFGDISVKFGEAEDDD